MKTIIAVSGRGNLGKTSAIRKLAERFPFSIDSIECKELLGDDILLIGKYQGKTIGFVSQGDPSSCQEECLEKCMEAECEVIVSACRTYGSTVDCIETMAEKHGYEVIYSANYYFGGGEMYGSVNLSEVFAESMEGLINKLLK